MTKTSNTMIAWLETFFTGTGKKVMEQIVELPKLTSAAMRFMCFIGQAIASLSVILGVLAQSEQSF